MLQAPTHYTSLLLSPLAKQPLVFSKFVLGLLAHDCNEAGHLQTLPTDSAFGWTQKDVGMGLPGQPRASRQQVPQHLGVPAKAVGCSCLTSGREGPSLGKQVSGGEGTALPVHTTAPKPGWLWSMGTALDGSHSNKSPPHEKEKKASSVTLNQNSKSSVRLLSGVCFVPFKKHSLMRMKYEGSCRSQILC